jgi:ketosteroid isomerase-like protein
VNHVETVQQMYEAFGKGDVPAILAHLATDVEWEYGVNSTDVPWLQPRRGRDQVMGFFEALAAIEFHSFVPTTFLSNADVVVVLLDISATVRATGKPVEEVDQVHIWHFSPQGEVIRFRHRADTHQQWTALRGD